MRTVRRTLLAASQKIASWAPSGKSAGIGREISIVSRSPLCGLRVTKPFSSWPGSTVSESSRTDSIAATFRPGSIWTSQSMDSIRTGAIEFRTRMLTIDASGLNRADGPHLARVPRAAERIRQRDRLLVLQADGGA